MYALVDCNNFYVSCERLFNPSLEGKPVVVLSNNDGCAISRSEEAKAVGVKMGAIPHLNEEIFRKHKIIMFSSNYTLYGDISDRVMQTLASLVPRLEIYSIDEAFLDLENMPHTDLLQLGLAVKQTIRQHIGIPVCVGIAPTKTLAKMANRYAKKMFKERGVHYVENEKMIREMLEQTPIEDVWGIGRQRAILLNRHGFKTALDLSLAPDEWVRKEMSVTGLRLVHELRGISSIENEFDPAPKKNICTGRSFGALTSDKGLIREALSNFTANCGLKLRKEGSVARQIRVFLNTNQHRVDLGQYNRSIVIEPDRATNHTPELIKYTLKGLDIIFKEGYMYKKAGVEMLDLVPENELQYSMFTDADPKSKKAGEVLDAVNRSMGSELLRYGVQGFDKKYKARAAHLSPCYTTNFGEVVRVPPDPLTP